MTTGQAVAALDAIDASDPERAHGLADAILLMLMHGDVEAAYDRPVERCSWWATA